MKKYENAIALTKFPSHINQITNARIAINQNTKLGL